MATRQNLGPEGPRRGGEGRHRETLPGTERGLGEGIGGVEETGQGIQEKARGMGERLKERAGGAVESGKSKVAGRIDRLGERLENRARPMEEQGGVKGAVGGAVHRAGDALESGADYLRTTDVGSMGSDLKGQIREHPFASVGIALGTGFVLGRIMGGGEEEKEREFREDGWRREVRGQNGGGFFSQVRGPLGRAVVGGVGTLMARQLRQRIGGTQKSQQMKEPC